MLTIKADILEKARAVQADECRKSFFYFVKTFWHVIIPEPPVWNWHIEYLCNEIQFVVERIARREKKLYDLIINIPPGTTKSTIVTVMAPAWAWATDATLRIISNSYSSDIALDHSTKSKDIITSALYQILFPEVIIRRDKSAKGAYENTKKGARYTTSTGSAITGKHAHLKINDDPQNPKQAYSEVLRQASIEQTKTLSTRNVDHSISVNITVMQRLHDEDVTGYLLKNQGSKIKHICLPAELSDNVKPESLKANYKEGLLDPIRLNRDALAEQKTNLGSRGYAGQFEQSPVVAGGNIIKEEWFRIISLSDFKKIATNDIVCHSFLDTAYDKEKNINKNGEAENDPSGLLTGCRIDNNLYIVNALKMWKEFPDLIRFLKEYCPSWHNSQSTLRIEPKSNGKSVVHQLRDETDLNVTETPTPTDSKEVRLNASAPKVECARVYLVDSGWVQEFIDEICGFPNKTHDEYVDLLCYAIDYFLNGDNDKPLKNTKEEEWN